MKQAASILVLAGSALALASCTQSGSANAGGMYVLSCTLGCTNGIGGTQVSCGIVNTFQNQDIAILFSEPVDFASVNNSSFQVFDVATGAVPPGSFDIDDANPRRLVFRPKLSFDASGNPIHGFAQDGTYQIKLPGTGAGDLPPYVMSTGGKENTSRVFCTIRTDQGLVDPVPGAPRVTIRVVVEDPITHVQTEQILADGSSLSNVALDSTIKFEFSDLMNIGTLLVPTTGQASFITVKVDPDGDLSDASDQIPRAGTYTYSIDQANLRTNLVFTPSAGFPGAGSDPLHPRRIVIDVPGAVRDLVGNGVANSGKRTFVPLVVPAQTVDVPAGGEQFLDQANMDSVRTGAFWGETQLGRLQPGIGGGSGRLGDLTIDAGDTLTLATSPIRARGGIFFTLNPKPADLAFMEFNGGGFAVEFKVNVTDPITQTKIDSFISDTLGEAAVYLNTNPGLDPEIGRCRYWVQGGTTLACEYLTPGTAGNTFSILFGPNYVADVIGGANQGPDSFGTLAGGLDYAEFTNVEDFLTNTAAGGTVAPITIDDGVFEFSSITLGTASVLRFVGDNPPRLFARGRVTISDLAEIQVVGAGLGQHASDGPHGQTGAEGASGGGSGGNGAYRPDNTGSDLLTLPNANPFRRGVTNQIGGVPVPADGFDGEGVGGVPGLGQGIGGINWPTIPPTALTAFGGMDTNGNCFSEQVGAGGSGGGYSLDGSPSAPLALTAQGILGTNNAPPPTGGGQSSNVGLGPTNPPGAARQLDPESGFLRGGSGGGGGGSTITDTNTTANVSPCLTSIDEFYSHSGSGGGAGGGAVQVVAGRLAQIDGRIDASGGDGGDVSTTAVVNGLGATPGGGGSGGGVLIQSRAVDLAYLSNRIDVRGGTGGFGPDGALGGDGGPGLVRIEDLTALDPDIIDDSIEPAVSGPPPAPQSDNWLSVGVFGVESTGPAALSGAQSCWMQPTCGGSPCGFFSLAFDSDDLMAGTVGWDMDLYLDLGAGEIRRSFRTEDAFGSETAEEHWGNTLGSSPVLIRFQGAKSTGAITDPCNLDPNDPFAPVLPGSLTPWVQHPDELNAFNPPSDMIRFQIVFDRSHPEFSFLRGVTDVGIKATGD